MRNLDVSGIEKAVAELCREANYTLTEDVLASFRRGAEREESPIGREVFGMLLENAAIAARESLLSGMDVLIANHEFPT